MKKHSTGSGLGVRRRTLQVEQLEGRAMLAGNVSVSVTGGNLFVTGDNHDNLVLIQQVDVGEYSVTGADFDNVNIDGTHIGGPTSINGDPDGTVTVSGVTGNIIVNLKNGNDALGIGNSIQDLASLAEGCGFSFSSVSETREFALPGDKFFAPANLVVNLGNGSNDVAVVADVALNLTITQSAGAKGSDNIAVGGSFENESDAFIGSPLIPGSLVISTGKGNDNICVDHATIYGSLVINAGDGNNAVSATNFDALSAAVTTGKGNDAINLNSFDVDTTVTVYSGDGNDAVSVTEFDSGEGTGPNGLPRGTGGVTIITDSGRGRGNDAVEVTSFDLRGNLVITTFGGNDAVDVSNEFDSEIDGPDDDDLFGNVVIDTGAGSDAVGLGGGIAADKVHNLSQVDGGDVLDIVGNLVVLLGSGNDFLGAGNVSVFQDRNGAQGNATIDAGGNNDDVEIDNSTIDTIFTILMGSGNDFLGIFNSFGGTPLAILIADGGSGRDTFENDLGIDSNGVQDFDPNGVPHEIIKNFEIFNADMIPVASAKIKKSW